VTVFHTGTTSFVGIFVVKLRNWGLDCHFLNFIKSRLLWNLEGGCKEFTISSAEESDDDQKKFEVLHSATLRPQKPCISKFNFTTHEPECTSRKTFFPCYCTFVDCGHLWTVERGVKSGECRVWTVKCRVWSVKRRGAEGCKKKAKVQKRWANTLPAPDPQGYMTTLHYAVGGKQK